MSDLMAQGGHLISKGGHLARSNCCYQQMRNCVTGALADVWIVKPAPSTVKIGATCYHNAGDPPSCNPGTVYGSSSYTVIGGGCSDPLCPGNTVDSCASCGISSVRIDLSVSVCTGCYQTCVEFGDGGSVSQRNIRDISGSYCVPCSGDWTFFNLPVPPFFYDLYTDFNCGGTQYNERTTTNPYNLQMFAVLSGGIWEVEVLGTWTGGGGSAGGTPTLGIVQATGNGDCTDTIPLTLTASSSNKDCGVVADGCGSGGTWPHNYYKVNSISVTPNGCALGGGGGGGAAMMAMASPSIASPSIVAVPTAPNAPTSTASTTVNGADVWGPAMWGQLHGRPKSFMPTPAGRAKERQWLTRFQSRIPCGICARHWAATIANMQPDLTSQASYFTWTVTAHNAVNRMLTPQKPQMAIADAAKLWGYN